MIELKILTNNADELRIIGVALLELAKLTDGEDFTIPDSVVSDEELPPILQEQNPIEQPQQNTEQQTQHAVDKDTSGYPWDERIHSTAHSRNQNGTWKFLRRPKKFDNDEPGWHTFIETVQSELRGEEYVDPAVVFGSKSAEQSENPAASVQEQSTTDTSTDTTDTVDFATLMKFISGNDAVTVEKVGEVCNMCGHENIISLQKDPEMIQMVYDEFVKIVKEAA